MESFSLNINGRVREYEQPLVMGILNVTPDSFFDGSRTIGSDGVIDSRRLIAKVEKMIADGADMIDVGGYSSRPGADDVTPEEELRRLEHGVKAVKSVAPECPVSVDTFRAAVARRAVADFGADIINDISGGELDGQMFSVVASLKVPYILMHMRGTPSTMQSLTQYPDGVVAGVVAELSGKVKELERLGVADVIVDPGFGFSKTAEQNYKLMDSLEAIGRLLERPLLIGVSRKSMIYKPLGISPADSLPGTVALNVMALERGASVLRVHDVAETRQALEVWKMMEAARG